MKQLLGHGPSCCNSFSFVFGSASNNPRYVLGTKAQAQLFLCSVNFDKNRCSNGGTGGKPVIFWAHNVAMKKMALGCFCYIMDYTPQKYGDYFINHDKNSY